MLIYIPLCIYFNIKRNHVRDDRIGFTFHYVSISTEEFARGCGFSILFTFHYVSISTNRTYLSFHLLITFTFHYVSISTNLQNIRQWHYIYLHSTMYLFQQTQIWNEALTYLFTFHYVSISTGNISSIFQCNYNLHSTMYLFQLPSQYTF